MYSRYGCLLLSYKSSNKKCAMLIGNILNHLKNVHLNIL